MVIKTFGKIAIGCFVILIILAILLAVFGKGIIKKIITGAIKEKTGVEVNVNEIDKDKLSYTDPRTGQTLNIGENKIPDNFPSDFPIYKGSAVTSSLTGKDFWLTLTTTDDENKVISYYKENLEKNGWKIQNGSGNDGTNWIVSKNNLSGYLTITKGDSQTSILIVLGEVNQ